MGTRNFCSEKFPGKSLPTLFSKTPCGPFAQLLKIHIDADLNVRRVENHGKLATYRGTEVQEVEKNKIHRVIGSMVVSGSPERWDR